LWERDADGPTSLQNNNATQSETKQPDVSSNASGLSGCPLTLTCCDQTLADVLSFLIRRLDASSAFQGDADDW
jgi:hypothetical protein